MTATFAQRRPLWRLSALLTGVALFGLALLGLWTQAPASLETHYAHGVGAQIAIRLGTVTGWVPFSLAEWVVPLFLGGVGLLIVSSIVQIARKTWTLRQALQNLAVCLVPLSAWTVLGFYVLWGLNYARQPAMERMGWTEPEPDHATTTLEIALLADDLVKRTNEVYVLLHGTDDVGQMTTPPSHVNLESAIEEGWRNAVRELRLPADVARYRGPAKPLLSSTLFSFMGISGVYFPFTAEANVNIRTPGWQLPHTIAHEKAHQRGFASEDEANFFGFAACLHSPDPWVRYAGLLFAQRRLQMALLKRDPDVAIALIERRHPGVQRDVTDAKTFWAGHQGHVSDWTAVLNDTYLRANRVEGGIGSYALSTRLLLAYASSERLEFPEPIPLRKSR